MSAVATRTRLQQFLSHRSSVSPLECCSSPCAVISKARLSVSRDATTSSTFALTDPTNNLRPPARPESTATSTPSTTYKMFLQRSVYAARRVAVNPAIKRSFTSAVVRRECHRKRSYNRGDDAATRGGSGTTPQGRGG